MLRRLKWQVVKTLGNLGYDLERDATSGRLGLHKRLQLGLDHLQDVATILGRPNVSCILDVGANVGQTAVDLRRHFPGSTIYSFEPDPGAFGALTRNVSQLERVEPINVALGSEAGTATFYLHKFDQTNSLLRNASGAEEFVVNQDLIASTGEISVPVSTVDDFCASRSIESIDLLKVDTQGYEMKVLEGADRMIREQRIRAMYLEVAFVPFYEGQALFQDLYRYVYERGFRMVGIYESGFRTHFYQVGGNALFIHQSLGKR
jgi:FkbM family methyltransferase